MTPLLRWEALVKACKEVEGKRDVDEAPRDSVEQRKKSRETRERGTRTLEKLEKDSSGIVPPHPQEFAYFFTRPYYSPEKFTYKNADHYQIKINEADIRERLLKNQSLGGADWMFIENSVDRLVCIYIQKNVDCGPFGVFRFMWGIQVHRGKSKDRGYIWKLAINSISTMGGDHYTNITEQSFEGISRYARLFTLDPHGAITFKSQATVVLESVLSEALPGTSVTREMVEAFKRHIEILVDWKDVATIQYESIK